MIAPWQVGAANRPGKKGIADKQHPPDRAGLPHLKADPARTVARRVMHDRLIVTETPWTWPVVIVVDRWRRVDS